MTRRFQLLLFLSLTVASLAACGRDSPVPVQPPRAGPGVEAELPPGAPLTTASPESSAVGSFEGIVAFANCSGAMVRFDHSQEDEPAYILTNGHCIGRTDGYMRLGEVIQNLPAVRRVGFNDPSDPRAEAGFARTETLVYATMTKTDVALYRLNKTFREIRQEMNIRPYLISRRQPTPGERIEILSGYWARRYQCQIEAVVHRLLEGSWIFESSMRYSRPGCEIIDGTSGAPIVAEGTREVIGINNTSNERGEMCTLENPCEADPNGNRAAIQGFAYGQQTALFYGCFNSQGVLDLNRSECLLPRASGGGFRAANPFKRIAVIFPKRSFLTRGWGPRASD